MTAWALVPVKEFSLAKTRLGRVLEPSECAALAEHMVRDVLSALEDAHSIRHVAVMGGKSALNPLLREFFCEPVPEDPGNDLNSKLNAAAGILGEKGADTLLVLPGDLPELTGGDIDELLARHESGATLAVARRDNGTNALAITPPTAIAFQFGRDSARAHMDCARAAGIMARRLDLAAFARDIDTAGDLVWLCRQNGTGHTHRYLTGSGIRARLLDNQKAAQA